MQSEDVTVGDATFSRVTEAETVSRILGFARFCAAPAVGPPDHTARSRGWLDTEGQPIADGRALITALTSVELACGVCRLTVGPTLSRNRERCDTSAQLRTPYLWHNRRTQMSNDEMAGHIVTFALQCGNAADPTHAARVRGWIDEHDRPTREGRALVEALKQQSRYGAYRQVV